MIILLTAHYTDYFGTKVSVLFADSHNYQGVIIGRKGQDGPWITRFQDGTEDTVIDPKIDDDYTIIH